MSIEMIQLWGIAAILCMTVLTIMLMPLIRRRAQSIVSREFYDINVYKDQLDEVERDLARGILAGDQAKATRTEIKRRMLSAAQANENFVDGHIPVEKTNWALVSLIALVLPIGATVVYLGLGNPTLPDQPLAGRDMSAGIAEMKRRAEMSKTVDQLAEKMKSRPADMRGWALLGRSYMTLEKYDAAANSYGKAYDLSNNNPDAGSAYGEALTLAADSVITPEASAVFEAVITADEANPKARYYLAMLKVQQGDLRGAMQDWVDLVAVSPVDAPWLPMISDQFLRAAEESGIDPKTIQPTAEALAIAESLKRKSSTDQNQQMKKAPGPNREEMEAASQITEGERATMIKAMVERLANRLQDNPNDKDGWIKLERAYRVLGDTSKADEAAARAAELP